MIINIEIQRKGQLNNESRRKIKMNDKFRELSELGAGDFEHVDGSLIEHLQGTRELLIAWSASPVLQDAGLYHAAYGTDGFDESLVSTNQRNKISRIIGADAEELVYQYCACDRNYFFAQIGVNEPPVFRNRFTNKTYSLSASLLKQFCELTAANETEIAIDNPEFLAEHGKSLNQLFVNMSPYLSEAARTKTTKIFGN